MDEVTPEVTPEIAPVAAPVAAPEVVPETAPVVEPVVTDYFGTDGTLKEGWQSTLPEGYRDEKSLLTIKDTKTLARMFVDTKKMVGKNTIAIPSETSTEGEWNEYYRVGGRPDTVADYNLAMPEDFPKELADRVFPADRLAAWQERFFKGGVSKKAADAFINEFAQDMLVDAQNIENDKVASLEELKRGLAADWGNATAQNEHLGNMAITEGSGGDFEFQQRISDKFGSDPDFVRFAANLGKKFAEGKPPGFDSIPEPSDYREQIDALMADPLYMKGTQPQRMRIADKIMALRKLMTPEPATT